VRPTLQVFRGEVDDQLEMSFLKKPHLCWVAAINASFDVFELTLGISLPIDFSSCHDDERLLTAPFQ
jgi:hypothetical protein